MYFWLDKQWRTHAMHKIENMPLQPYSIFSCSWQMSQHACFPSKILCVVSILIGNHVHVKRLGIASGMANAWRPGSAKFTNAPDKARRANANPRGFSQGELSSTSLEFEFHLQLFLLLFMDGLFIGFLVEKCAACHSRKSNFGWHRFCFPPCLMRKRVA